MALNFGVSDIIVGINLALKIYEKGFNEENAADVRYRSFQNDISNFRYLLEKLNDALASAQQRYLDRRSAVLGAPGAYEPLSQDIESERKTIVGNFLTTLKECEKLLDENKSLRHRCSTVTENLKWNLLQQEKRVDDLRRRLHFHSEKIRLVLDRLSITLLTDLDAKVDDLLAISEQNLQTSREILMELGQLKTTWLGYIAGQGLPTTDATADVHNVSDLISQKLSNCLFIHAPMGIESGIPVAEGFDALLLHFEQSVDIRTEATPEKYLLFLKTRWLLARLKEGEEYKQARPGFYYKRAINQIEQAVLSRTRQPGELIPYDDSILAELQESCFHIWPTPLPAAPVQYSQAHPLHVRANEEQVTMIKIASSDETESESITVFKSSDERLRIVLKTTLASAPGEKLVIPTPVYVRDDKMIPRYAMPTVNDDSLEIAIFSRNEETLYRFDTFADLCNFQSALIGYEVSHHQERVQFQFSKDLKALDCNGRVQLWQDPIVLPPPVQRRLSERPMSPGAQDTSSDGTWSRRDSVMPPSIAAASTISPVEDGWEAQPIKLPAITVFTQITEGDKKDRFAIIYIQLDEGISIDPTECACCRDYEKCSKLVLTSKRRGKPHFPVRILYSEIDTTGNPNPNTFDLFPFRLPRHPAFDKITTKQTEYLLLKFKSLEEKKLFHRELDARFQVREAQIRVRKEFQTKFQYRQNRPQRRQGPYSPPSMHLQPENLLLESTTSVSSNSTISPMSTTPEPRAPNISPPMMSGTAPEALRQGSLPRNAARAAQPRPPDHDHSALRMEVRAERATSKKKSWIPWSR